MLSTAGSYRESGLPNIIGSFRIHNAVNAACEVYNTQGAFYAKEIGTYSYSTNTNTSNGNITVGFDASKYNSIYGLSQKVRPASLQIQYLIKY